MSKATHSFCYLEEEAEVEEETGGGSRDQDDNNVDDNNDPLPPPPPPIRYGADVPFTLRLRREEPSWAGHRSTELRVRAVMDARAILPFIRDLRHAQDQHAATQFPENVDPDDVVQQATACLRHYAEVPPRGGGSGTSGSGPRLKPTLVFFDIPRRIGRLSIWRHHEHYRMYFVDGAPGGGCYSSSSRCLQRRRVLGETSVTMDDQGRPQPILVHRQWSFYTRNEAV